MAWRFHAIDAMLSTELRLLDGVEVHEGLTSRRESRSRVDRAYHTQVLQDKDQQIDINRKKAVDVMRACFKPILPDQGAKLLHRVQNLPPPSVSRNPKCIDLWRLRTHAQHLGEHVEELAHASRVSVHAARQPLPSQGGDAVRE